MLTQYRMHHDVPYIMQSIAMNGADGGTSRHRHDHLFLAMGMYRVVFVLLMFYTNSFLPLCKSEPSFRLLRVLLKRHVENL